MADLYRKLTVSKMCFFIFPDSCPLTCSGMGNFSGKPKFQDIIMEVQPIRNNLHVSSGFRSCPFFVRTVQSVCVLRVTLFFLASKVIQYKINIRCWSCPSFIINLREMDNEDRFIAYTDMPVLFFAYMAF